MLTSRNNGRKMDVNEEKSKAKCLSFDKEKAQTV